MSTTTPPEQSAIDASLRSTLLWLCEVASPIGEEKALCDLVAERLAHASLASPIRRYGDSLVVPLARKNDGRPHVVLAGHLDTVRTENGPARIEGDRCFGAGAADMKAGLALMIVLAEMGRPPCDLTLVFYAREEGPYEENELGVVLREDGDLRTASLAVCLEPSDNRLHLGCCGSIHATVTFEGKTGHSARPWEGDNAITKAAGLLERLAKLAPIDHDIEGMRYRTTTTVTLANGGRGRNVVPDRFILNLNHRFAPSGSLAAAQDDVRRLVGADAHVEFTDLSPAAMPNRAHPLVEKLVAAGVRGVESKQAWTDVARFSALGIAAINFGPGENAQAHQRNESTSLPLLYEGYRIMAAWLASLAR